MINVISININLSFQKSKKNVKNNYFLKKAITSFRLYKNIISIDFTKRIERRAFLVNINQILPSCKM